MPGKILSVDDSFDNRQLLLRTLGRTGYEVVEAGDGKEGLTRAFELLPELILLDIVMPELDGYQVCEALKKDRRHVTCHQRNFSKIPNSCQYDFLILRGPLWGGRFQMPVIGER